MGTNHSTFAAPDALSWDFAALTEIRRTAALVRLC